MKNSELLTAGADVIVRNGWVQDDYFQDIRVGTEDDLDQPGSWLPAEQCPVCPRAALAVAAGGHPLDYSKGWVPPWDRLMSPEVRERGKAVLAAETALAEFLRDPWPEAARMLDGGFPVDTVIERWADEDGRTLEEILRAMRRAADGERKAGR